jgi:hypothetical protein
MKLKKKDLDAIIDGAAKDIRDEQIDASIINQSATRVWARVSQETSNLSSATSSLEHINIMNTNHTADAISGCGDFQSLIPDYLNGKLSAARTLLLEDHSSECIPCRNEIRAQRNVTAPAATINLKPAVASRSWFSVPALRWSFAAVAAIAIGITGLFVYERLDLSGTTLAATLENANGEVYVVSENSSRLLGSGEQLQKGETVRTAKDSNALLKLADGSTVEMRERSEFSVSENNKGVTVHLDRGDVIVEAAKQHNGKLFVQTPDSLVSVKGTIFVVESGMKGSRVSVVEGEVEVNHAGKDEKLLPGDQTTTSTNLDRTPVAKNVSWSRNAAKYTSLVTELGKLRKDVVQQTARPGVRYSSKLVDLVPENSVFYAALPNLAESLVESQRVMQERIKQNPALADWWKGRKGGDEAGINEQTLARIQEFGSQLGEEIVISAELDAKGEPSDILVLGEVKNAAGFRSYLDGQLPRIEKETGKSLNVRIIEDPLTAAVAAPSKKENGSVRSELFVWINNDIFAASPQIESLRKLANTLKAPNADRFANSSFHQRINDVYKDGAGLLVAADLEKIVAQTIGKDKSPEAARHTEGLKQLGVMNLRHFVVEQKEVQGKTLSQAALTFNESNRGIASWLAAPGSMGALEFISPNANVATAFVVKEPALLVDDLLAFMETADPDIRNRMKEMEKQQGFDIRSDFAAPLGGEFAFAIDGPILPTPSWKLILEVYDQAKLQNTFERVIEKLNQFSIIHGKGKLNIESSVAGDRTFYSIKSNVGLEVHYMYSNGYLVAAPSLALLEQSLRNRDAGNTLVSSSRFKSSLPQDGNTNFSAIFYHDLAPLMSSLAEKMKNAGGAGQQDNPLASIDPNAPPTLAYAYAQGDRITFAANTEGGAFGLSPGSLIGLPHSFEMQHILMNALGEKGVHKKE